MNEQMSLFQSDNFDNELLEFLYDHAKAIGYPEATFSIQENISKKGKNEGKLISKTIFLNEASYPYDTQNKIAKSTSLLLMYPNKTMYEIKVTEDVYKNVVLPSSAIVKKESTDKDKSVRILFDMNTLDILSYSTLLLDYILNNYTSSNTFGCCSRYAECSASKKCSHPNKLYAKGCQYRKNLEKGKIFY